MGTYKKSRASEAGGWKKADEHPERWEHPEFGVIIEREPDLWSFQPICGHDHYAAFGRVDAQTRAERRSGLCYGCWAAATAAAAKRRSPSVDVVVVDDDIDIREALSEALEDCGYSVLSAANGVEGLELLRSRDVPRVILLDLMMPLMDGYRFRAQQREDPALAAIPVVVITAGASVRNDELDAVAVLRKPLDLSKLLTTIEQHCNC